MNTHTNHELLRKLLSATKPSQVQAILKSLGDCSDLPVDKPFGTNAYRWHFYGNRESNMSTINLGSQPGRSLTERVTNAIDAVLEKQMAKRGGQPPQSPMEAAKRWFGRPPTSAESGLYSWNDFATQDYDRLVQVVLTVADKDAAPTVDVIDDGIGIEPNNFSNTIISLQAGNKITKRYQVGAWGQGGSATIGFSDYVLIVSRHVDNPTVVGFTIIKLMKLDEPYKEDAYVYLAVLDNDGNLAVPSCEWEGLIDFYPATPAHPRKPKAAKSGTLVRHYGYKLDGLDKTLSASPGNLYHLLQYMMFDPLLPFRIIDLRKEGAFKDELITGSRNRLMKYTINLVQKQEGEELEAEETGTVLRHFAPREMISPRSDVDPSIGVEYWVILNWKKSKDKTTLRTHSNELFIERNHPVVGTLNGQNQGDMTARILRELQLSMVAPHIVIHIDASQVTSDIRRNLFTSTREDFKEGEVLTEVTRVLTNMLKEDGSLYEIERELVETLLHRDNSEANKEVKKQITNLLRDAGLDVKEPGEVLVAGGKGEIMTAPPYQGHRPGKVDPLETREYPEVTYFKIVYPEDMLIIHQQDNQVIKVETDANYRFDREGRLAIRSEPPKLEVASKGILQGGRINWRLRPTESSSPGDEGEIIISLTKPDGTQMVAQLAYRILAPREERTERVKGQVPPFDIVPIDPDQDREEFERVWGNIDSREDVAKLAYKALPAGGGIIVYYSTAFGPYKEQLEALKQKAGLAAQFSQNYEIWIGYHAIMQWQRRSSAPHLLDVTDEQLEKLQEHERTVVAAMQVKEALKMAEIQRQALKHNTLE